MICASRWLMAGAVMLAAAAWASDGVARGGGHRGGGRGGGAGDLCVTAGFLDLNLSTIDIMVALNAAQMAALDELRKVAKENADDMTRVCAGAVPATVPAKLAASEKRLAAALEGARKIAPAADKFYASLDAAQKAKVDDYVYWPGL